MCLFTSAGFRSTCETKTYQGNFQTADLINLEFDRLIKIKVVEGLNRPRAESVIITQSN